MKIYVEQKIWDSLTSKMNFTKVIGSAWLTCVKTATAKKILLGIRNIVFQCRIVCEQLVIGSVTTVPVLRFCCGQKTVLFNNTICNN
jgi:hypothetical protein